MEVFNFYSTELLLPTYKLLPTSASTHSWANPIPIDTNNSL